MLKKTIYNIILSIIVIYSCGCNKKYSFSNDAKIHNYTRSAPRMRLAGACNASGITYNPDTKTLFMIEDSPTVISELNNKGEIIRSIEIENLNDTEGIAYLGNKRFAIVEESTSKIYFCSIGEKTTRIKYKDMVSLDVPLSPNNTGLEGITYDSENKCFYVIKEKDPMKIFRIYLGSEKIEIPWDLEKIDISDASDICFDPNTGHLLILSHESKCVVECTVDGKELSRLSLRKGDSSLKREFKKPEGITINPKTNQIFICGENDEFYIFSPKKQDK
jgi:uncharacterized protein YjiK